MTYTGDSLIVSQGQATAAMIDACMAEYGRRLAASFAPDGQYQPPPAGLGAAFLAWCDAWEPTVNVDLAVGQCIHETAGWQSVWARQFNNPAGLGVTGQPGRGERFTTPDEGIECHIAHLLTYAVGDGPWKTSDRRYASTPVAWRGACPRIADLNGRWATPGTIYGQTIASVANALLETGDDVPGFEMPSDINGVPVRKAFIPAGNSNRPGTPATAEGRQWITVHETANLNSGANAEMHRRYTHAGGGASPGNEGVSFTFVVDDTEIVWLLPLEEKSWQASDGANGPGNSSASIETCVNADGNWTRTKEHLAQLVAFLATHAPGRSLERIAQHNKWARDHKNCPTRLRANNGAEWNALMNRVRDIAAGGTPERDAFLLDGNPHGSFGFRLGFKDWAVTVGTARNPADITAGALSITGWPLANEYACEGGAAQEAERVNLIYHAGNDPPWDIVVALKDAPLPPPKGDG